MYNIWKLYKKNSLSYCVTTKVFKDKEGTNNVITMSSRVQTKIQWPLSVTWVPEILVRRAHICIILLVHVSLPYRCYIPNLVKIDPEVLEKMLMHTAQDVDAWKTAYNNRRQPIAKKKTNNKIPLGGQNNDRQQAFRKTHLQ